MKMPVANTLYNVHDGQKPPHITRPLCTFKEN